jgi:aryl-alcohol dehydrogenase-like predicted oxidoreductase
MVCGGAEVEMAPSERLACDWIQAHFIEALSAVGRDWFDFYFLRIRSNLAEHQVNGALLALENARQEGHIRHIGIDCLGSDESVRRSWQLHDAFEVALIHDPESRLIGFARERRVGIVTTFPSAHTTLLPFRAEARMQVAR